jgi:methylase of polypeptide subunit release factors
MNIALSNLSQSPTKAAKGLHYADSHSPNQVFFCPEESHFYAQCLERLVFNRCANPETIVEFGAGDGSPVISSLLKSNFKGEVHGFELSAASCEVARSRIQHYQLDHHYFIHNRCFFEGLRSIPASYLVANPPYIPAPDNNICMPSLHGGADGAVITRKLLSLDRDRVMVLISAYSNPIDTVEHAISEGYAVSDFMVTPLSFGYYSSEPKVKNWINELRKHQKAFYSNNVYFLAGALFQKKQDTNTDLADELLKVMTIL